MLQKSTILKKCFLEEVKLYHNTVVSAGQCKEQKRRDIYFFRNDKHTHTLFHTHTHFFLPHSHVCKVCRKTFNDNNLIINQGHKKHFIALDLIQLTKTFTDCNFKNICKLWKTLLALFFVTFMCNLKFSIYFLGTDPFQLSF